MTDHCLRMSRRSKPGSSVGVVVATPLGDDPNDMQGYPGSWEKKAALWERIE